MHDTATRVADVGRALGQAARAAAFARQADGFARAVDRAAEIRRSVDAHARATGQDPAGYIVLTPGSPEWLKAARDLQRARAL